MSKPPNDRDIVMTPNNSTCAADSIFEPYTFGYASFVEDHFKNYDRQLPFFTNPVIRDDCCQFDSFVQPFSRDLYCTEEFMFPQVNLIC